MNLLASRDKKLTRKTKIIAIILITISIVGGAFFFAKKVMGLGVFVFGGPIVWVDYCTCSGNMRLTIGPPVPGRYVFQPGASMLYLFYQVYRPGPWTLGGGTAGGSCSIYVGTGCATLPTSGTIRMIGTSL
ncbi:MAG: hypothetical protein A2675_00105 [Candidatus Yonathbacteria bacterium RIFCSPHIGHO2_01_FULL_51_10]|uniref:Uncharacterized protein n=1 Tax=Candidatus Yonathbacteria bacterium RIFCSPHIGHO2_01_FULL_51_10 TaxID=1802723 RepID=A0A1G2S8U5_9BACT|nr:MAG: hypothetical protein A2675_00105 [Candidatus Yonathbacteria bacterium RIFCSPHIGHO2_01_FULL_51_10]